MKLPHTFAAFLLALPLAATAQTTPTKATTPAPTTTKTTAGTQQVTEVTEDLDPATGKVIRRTTRTTTLPAGTPLPGTVGTTTTTNSSTSTTDLAGAKAGDAQVSAFLRRKTTVATLSSTALLSTYEMFIERLREDRQNWKPADWAKAAAVMSSLNDRYEQLRSGFSLDDKLTIRSQQAEFQALRTARQISTQVSDKL